MTGGQMLSFGLRNLRRLASVNPVEIKPITILVGRNSSGKSSFLRAFPLLRQSLMTRTSSPVLWFGDFVDFGSFHGAVTDNSLDKAISLIFGVDDLTVPELSRYGMYFNPERARKLRTELEVDIGLIKEQPSSVAANEQTHIASFRLKLENENVHYDVRMNDVNEISSLTINGQNALEDFAEYRLTLSQGTVFPELVLRPRDEAPPASSNRFYMHESQFLLQAMGKALSPHLHGRIKKDTLDRYSAALLSLSELSKETLLKLSNEIQAAQSFKNLLADVAVNDVRSLFSTMERIFHANRFPFILGRLSVFLRETLSNTLYIGPARARSERYYRYQDLAVSEIDSNGTNFPMFLSSLSRSQLSQLSDWVEELFNYRLEIKQSVGHLSINLIEGVHSTNIVDTGYGVSQILPVLGQIWWATKRPRTFDSRSARFRERSSILAIEQPELHLHPAHQALLADAIAAQSQSAAPDEPLHFVVETHSETLVNRLGELIAAKKLDPESVQILVFEPHDEEARVTTVDIARFGSDGELINWPYGFFQASAR